MAATPKSVRASAISKEAQSRFLPAADYARAKTVDYTKMAAGYGMNAEGPITDPTKLSAALKRGVASVKRGEPYLIDVITQPR